MTSHLQHIADRVLGQPLLILPSKLGVIAQILAGRIGLEIDQPELGLEPALRPAPLASRFVGARRDADTGQGLPYVRTDAGAALITVTGSLVNRGAWIGASSGLTSYEGVAAQIRAALADPKVQEIVFDLATPGGEATGAFELASLIRQAGETKPTTAFVNGMAASAGYMIASGARRIVSIPSGLTGSIGVVMMHADYSRALDRAGITPTLIYSGQHKVDGNPYAPLDADTKARLKGEVDAMREEFVQAVAAGRGRRMTAKAARDTEAAVFTAKEAKDLGLVDEVATFDALYESMNRAASGRDRSVAPTRRTSMELTQADLDRARAEGVTAGRADGMLAGRAEGHAAGLSDGKVAGAAAERARIKTIVESPEAKGREALAAHYAYATDQAPETAEAALKVAPKASALDERAAATTAGFHTAGTGQKRPAATIDASALYARLNKPDA